MKKNGTELSLNVFHTELIHKLYIYITLLSFRAL
jgi:hypothetical protein